MADSIEVTQRDINTVLFDLTAKHAE